MLVDRDIFMKHMLIAGGSEIVDRLREMAGYKYQSHTLHVPAVMCKAASTIEFLYAELKVKDHQINMLLDGDSEVLPRICSTPGGKLD